MEYTHLEQRPSGHIFIYSEPLAELRDMYPCNLDANGKPDHSIVNEVPEQMKSKVSVMLTRLDDLERQVFQLTEAINGIPGAAELMNNRKPIDVPEPAVMTAIEPPKGPEPVEVVEVEPENPAIAQAKQAIDAALNKVAAQEKYLEDRIGVQEGAQRDYDAAESAVETAGPDFKDAANKALVERGESLRQAGIKVKSATTKLKNANTALENAKAELADLQAKAG